MLRMILLPSRRIREDESFQLMHPSFRNLLFTAILLLDNYSGVIKITRSLLFKMMNETPQGGNDILEAFQKQHPEWIYYDDDTHELGILMWPNCIYGQLKPRQLAVLERDLGEVLSIQILKLFCQYNHSSKTELIRSRLSQIQIDLINEKEAEKKLQLLLNGSPQEVPDNQHFNLQTKTETKTKTETIYITGVETPAKEGFSSPHFEAINGDPSKKKLWERLNKKDKPFFPLIIQIVDYFREVTGKAKTGYHTGGALKLMKKWIREGYKLDDFKAVIDFKTDYFTGKGDHEYINLDTYCRESTFEDNLSKARDWKVDHERKALEFDPEQFPDIDEGIRSSYKNKYLVYVSRHFPDMVAAMSHLTVRQYEDFMKMDQPWNDRVNMTPSSLQKKFIQIHQEAMSRKLKVGVILSSRLLAVVKQLANI